MNRIDKPHSPRCLLPCLFNFQRKPAKGDEGSPGDGEEAERSDDEGDYWSPPTSEVELYSVFQNKKFGMIPSNEVRSVYVSG